MVACDVYRPAAIDQLETLGKSLNIDVYSNRSTQDYQLHTLMLYWEDEDDGVLVGSAPSLSQEEAIQMTDEKLKELTDGTWKVNNVWSNHNQWHIRYIPILNDCIYRKSLWEVKTVLPRSEVNDSRPILCKFNYGLKGFHCVMGGKIDNAYDAVAAVQKELAL